MNDLHQLVREALERRRETHQGCFVHNAAAVELLSYGADAINAIESVLLAARGDDSGSDSSSWDLDSVLVVYARLIRQFQLEDRCVEFLRRLAPCFKRSALAGIRIVWSNNHPKPEPLPEPILGYVQELLVNGTAPEQRVARMALRDCKRSS